MDLVSRLSFSVSRMSASSDSPIDVKNFVDFDLDVVGWYAKGHPDAKSFLKAIAKQTPFKKLSIDRVMYTWAIFEDNHFELVDRFSKGAEPIILIEENE